MRPLSPYRRILFLAFLLPGTYLACDGGTSPGDEPDNLIGPEGGTVTSGLLTLVIPAGALDEPAEITATPLTDAGGAAPTGFVVMDGTGFDLRPDGLTFNEPAMLSIRIADLPLPDGVSLSELRLLRLDGTGVTLPSELDAGQETVTGTIDHFSEFGVGLETQFSREACPDLSLGATSGMPLDRVDLGAVPDDFEAPLLVVATAADDSTRSYGAVEVDDAGAAAMVVPIHPSADPAGGDVTINVSDGTLACAGVDFTIDALPGAAGELEAVVDLLQDMLSAQAAELGTTPAELMATPLDSLPPALVPLVLTQSVIDDPDNDHALRAIVDGTSSQAADAHLDLMEPLLARTGLRSALSAIVAAAAASPDGADVAAGPGLGGTASSIIAGLCTPEYVTNAELLDYCMEKAASAAFQGAGDKVLNDLNEGMMYAGLVPGLGTATAIGGAVIWVVQTEDKRDAALLPSLLTKMELEASPEEFQEDQEGPGTWSASVYASNQGYDMGKEFLEGALQGAAIAGIADKAQIAGPEIGNLTSWVLTGPVANKLLEGGTIDEFIIEASDYGPVPVNEDTYSEATIVGTALSKGEAHTEYNPEEPGTATLVVNTAGGKFGYQQVNAQQELTVRELTLTVSPAEVILSASEPQTFSFTVHDAKHPERVMVVDPGALQGTVGDVTYIGGGLHTVEYTAPSAPNTDQTDLLVMQDTATTGAMKNTGPRAISATIRFGDLQISPRGPCVANGDVQTFTADVSGGLGTSTVHWEITSGGGSLSSTTGTSVDYTAPSSGAGSVTVHAYLENNTDNDDEVTFTYGVCSGLALYRIVSASIDFPFTVGGTCNNPDLDDEYQDSNLPSEGLDPLVPPDASALLIDRTDHPAIDLSQTGSVGGYADGDCVYATFLANSGYDAIFTGSPAADSIDIDIQTYAESECIDMGSLGVRCSGAAAAVGTTVRFDLEIDQAANYNLDLQLTCDAYVVPMAPEPTIEIITTRVEPDGSLVPPNTSTQPMSLACGGGNTVTVDHVLEFGDPSEAGQTDKVMIIIQFTNTSPGALEGISEARHDGYVQGYITLKKQ